jgi:hypothetical protein
LAFVTKLTIPFKKFTKEAAKVKEFKIMEEFNLTQKGIENFLTSNYERITTYNCKYTNVTSALSKES